MALDPITAGIGLAKTVIDKIWPDKSEQEKQALAQQFALIQGQMDVNKEEAKSTNWFVAGWRPAVGWVCTVGLGYQFLGLPLLSWISGVGGYPIPPSLQVGDLMTILLGMLGLGGLRTYEKLNGAARE